ncbi:MAG: hypothetical protein WC907_02585 [Acholeplasmataceae bacterium]
MIETFIKVIDNVKIIKKEIENDNFKTLEVNIKIPNKTHLQENDLFVGFKIPKPTKENSFLMTHEQSVTRYDIPFAFPAFMSVYGNDLENGFFAVLDYFKLEKDMRKYHKFSDDKYLYIGITNDEFKVNDNLEINLKINYQTYPKENKSLNYLIKKAAELVLDNNKMSWHGDYNYTTNIYNYEEAQYGLSINLLDFRARVQDGIGTFIPYGFAEKIAYSESFALMDVLKGMLPVAKVLNNETLLNLSMDELYKISNKDSEYPWIEYDHNTEGFFHLAWGGLPVGVSLDHIKTKSKGKFSDVDGHEEGPNLLSTWKYFYRVALLGEIALLTNDDKVINAFKSTLPFINKLKMENYAQPVTYDLDSHLPMTGKENGGSVGGVAFWSIIQLTAYMVTKNTFYLEEAIKALEYGNSLDFNNYYSMRVAPKPTTSGWLTKSNVYAYEITGDNKFLDYALNSSSAIYFHYYLNSHPKTYFQTEGFGYACARERWEAFLEMVESLYGISFYLKYSNDKNLFKLFWKARENWLWALPLNGNPYGNLNRPYDSIGGEYIPYEFSTGNLGDNPALDGGSQSSMRQIKEIYGSGEVYLAYMMFEMYATISNRNLLIIKSNYVNDFNNEVHNFIIYNNKETNEEAVVIFKNLNRDFYTLKIDNDVIGSFDKTKLLLGIKINVSPNEIKKLKLTPLKNGEKRSFKLLNLNKKISVSGLERVTLNWDKCLENDFSHYKIILTTKYNKREINITKNNLEITLDRELETNIKVSAITNDKILEYQPLILPPILKEFKFKINFEEPNIETKNLELINDNHILMFYGINHKKETITKFNLNHKINKNEILQLEISSINNGLNYEVYLTDDLNKNIKILQSNKPKLLEILLNDIDISYIKQLIIKSTSDKGLGYSVKNLNVITYQEGEEAIYTNLKTNITENQLQITENLNMKTFDYFDVYVTNSNINEGFDIYLNDKLIEMEIEKEYPEKKYRSMNGLYRFKTIKKDNVNIKIISKNKNIKINFIRLTNNHQYPKLADYKEYI